MKEFEKISEFFLNEGGKEGLRNRALFLMSHYGLMRGHNLREAELADLLLIEIENQGPSAFLAVTLTMRSGYLLFNYR